MRSATVRDLAAESWSKVLEVTWKGSPKRLLSRISVVSFDRADLLSLSIDARALPEIR
jgi:hypothetical protein